jgi:predicted dithiol-disulfide oxidoreductase (DUF899 family)
MPHSVSRVPLQRIEEVKSPMRWTFPLVSPRRSDFNSDFGVSFTPEDIAAGRALYNYGTVIRDSRDMFRTSIFVKTARDRRNLERATFRSARKEIYLNSTTTGRPMARTAVMHPP